MTISTNHTALTISSLVVCVVVVVVCVGRPG